MLGITVKRMDQGEAPCKYGHINDKKQSLEEVAIEELNDTVCRTVHPTLHTTSHDFA